VEGDRGGDMRVFELIEYVGTKRTCRGRLTMSAPEGKTDVPREPGHFLGPLPDIGDGIGPNVRCGRSSVVVVC
jgi:hypothetical protein